MNNVCTYSVVCPDESYTPREMIEFKEAELHTKNVKYQYKFMIPNLIFH
jgi:hypothetical protein